MNFSFPCWLVRALCYRSFCRNFSSSRSPINLWPPRLNLGAVGRWLLGEELPEYRYSHNWCRQRICEIMRHVNFYSVPRRCEFWWRRISKAEWLSHCAEWLRAGRSGFYSWQGRRFSVRHRIQKTSQYIQPSINWVPALLPWSESDGAWNWSLISV